MSSGALPIPVTLREFYLSVVDGNLPNARIYKIPAYKAAISATVWDDISNIPSATTIPLPSDAGIQMQISSDSASDAATLGGAHTVELHYLDANFLEKEEYLTLTGSTAVLTVATNIARVQWMHTTAAGSIGYPVGNISLTDAASGLTTYEYLLAGENQSMSSHYTVPSGKKAFILGWYPSGIKKEMQIRLRATCERYDRFRRSGIFMFQDGVALMNTPAAVSWKTPLLYLEKTDIKVSAKGDTAGGSAGATYEILVCDAGMQLE